MFSGLSLTLDGLAVYYPAPALLQMPLHSQLTCCPSPRQQLPFHTLASPELTLLSIHPPPEHAVLAAGGQRSKPCQLQVIGKKKIKGKQCALSTHRQRPTTMSPIHTCDKRLERQDFRGYTRNRF